MTAFLKNVWYLASWEEVVREAGLLARTIAGEPLLFLVDASGEIAALRDACPHRFAPLSLGTCEKGVVRCAYHGLAFDAAGACVDNPHGPIVAALSVRRYPAQIRYAAVWVWLGEEPANPAIAPVIFDALVAAFYGEDAPLLRAQDQRIGDADFWSLGPALLPSDKGAVMVRRALERRIAGEEIS